MFSGHVSSTDSNDYDFDKQENAAKWKGVFITSLKKVRPNVFCLLFVFCLSVWKTAVIAYKVHQSETWKIDKQ